jgi:3-deoxy-D-manno-octulosonate 8-phosphate phosphatase (KDO 8-P phosphatase)
VFGPGLRRRLRGIRVVAADVDGTLTPGDVTLDGSGGEWKRFSVRDGFGIRALEKSGVRVVFVTGRDSAAVRRRAEELGVHRVYARTEDKGQAFDALLRDLSVSPSEVLFVGDDIPDLPALRKAGVAVAVADACTEVVRVSDIRTRAAGGMGCLREIAEKILKARGEWGKACAGF